MDTKMLLQLSAFTGEKFTEQFDGETGMCYICKEYTFNTLLITYHGITHAYYLHSPYCSDIFAVLYLLNIQKKAYYVNGLLYSS